MLVGLSNTIGRPDTITVFVLLGKNLEKPPTLTSQYTHNWVSFEVGVAVSRLWKTNLGF